MDLSASMMVMLVSTTAMLANTKGSSDYRVIKVLVIVVFIIINTLFNNFIRFLLTFFSIKISLLNVILFKNT